MEAIQAHWIGDDGHAWLVVSNKLAQKVEGISTCSYVSPAGTKAYLEEDCDAYLFIEQYGEDNIEMGKAVRHKGQSPCRNYPRYNNNEGK